MWKVLGLLALTACAVFATSSLDSRRNNANENDDSVPSNQAQCALCRQLWTSALKNFGDETQFVPHDIITSDKTCRSICSRLSSEEKQELQSKEERERVVCDACIRLVDYWRRHKDDSSFNGEQDAKELFCDRFVPEARGDCEHTVSMYVTDIRAYLDGDDIDSQSICYLNHRLCRDIVGSDSQYAQVRTSPEDDARFNSFNNNQNDRDNLNNLDDDEDEDNQNENRGNRNNQNSRNNNNRNNNRNSNRDNQNGRANQYKNRNNNQNNRNSNLDDNQDENNQNDNLESRNNLNNRGNNNRNNLKNNNEDQE